MGCRNLFGACRADRALVVIKLQAARLERQAAVGQEPADLRFRILDHPLIKHPVNAAGQDGIEMGHELHIVAVIAADVLQPIGEVLAPRKMLFET